MYDLETYGVLKELTVEGGSGVGFMPTAPAIAVQSDSPITLEFVDNGSIGEDGADYGAGVMFTGIRPDQDTMFYLPTEAYVEAYFFASEETQLTIDNFAATIQADSPYLFSQPGNHIVHSNRNVILQVNFWSNEPDYQGLWFVGTAIPCIEAIDENPSVMLTPIGEGFPTMYIIIVLTIIAVAAIAVFLTMRKRR